MNIRVGKESDLEAVQYLINQLAIYEKEPDEVSTTVDDLLASGFGSNKIFDFLVAETHEGIKGFALFFWKYSTWKGKALYLEDFYVEPEYRGTGMGKQLFQEVVRFADNNGAKRMEWVVLSWNEPALKFYNKMGAKLDDEWQIGQLFPADFKMILK